MADVPQVAVTEPVPVAPVDATPKLQSNMPHPIVDVVAIAAGKVRRSDQHADMSEREGIVAAFEIDRTAVTRAQYDACVASDACPAPDHTSCPAAKSDDAPVQCVDFHEARAYCGWVGKQLPTEDEWELSKSKVTRGKDDFEWTVTRHCMPGEKDCLGLSNWAIDGWREPSIEAALRGDGSIPQYSAHERAEHLGIRCVRPTAPAPEPHPGECWATCDGCTDQRDGEPDLRHVWRWHKSGVLAAAAPMVVDATGRKKGAAPPSEALVAMTASADPTTIVHSANGRIVGFAHVADDGTTTREMLQHDAAGNVRSRISIGSKSRAYWTYHYGCWQEGKKLHPSLERCPLDATFGRVEPQAGFERCVVGTGGLWELVMKDVKIACEREPGVDMPCAGMKAEGTWAVAYTPKDGKRVLGPSEAFDVDSVSVLERRPIGSFDFDGDGHDELALRRMMDHVEDADPSVEIWTFKTVVQPYAPAAKLTDIEELTDVDGDGRLDVRIEGRFAIPSSGIMGDECVGGITSVARSLPDGTFAIDPIETIADRRQQCPKPSTGPFFGDDALSGDGLAPIACAYLWGTPKADLRKRVLAEWDGRCKTEDEDAPCMCDRKSIEDFVDGFPKLERRLDEP